MSNDSAILSKFDHNSGWNHSLIQPETNRYFLDKVLWWINSLSLNVYILICNCFCFSGEVLNGSKQLHKRTAHCILLFCTFTDELHTLCIEALIHTAVMPFKLHAMQSKCSYPSSNPLFVSSQVQYYSTPWAMHVVWQRVKWEIKQNNAQTWPCSVVTPDTDTVWPPLLEVNKLILCHQAAQ